MHPHLLAGFFAAFLTDCGWDKADFPRFRSPLLIVVGFSRRLTKVVLPEMYHLMREG
jgi:hypothetical protein